MKPRTYQSDNGLSEPRIGVIPVLSAKRHGQREAGKRWSGDACRRHGFGEMALLEDRRSADVWADTLVECLELTLDAYAEFRDIYPQVGERIIRNLAVLLAKRLISANTKIDLLTAH